jgi:hypothetical protein
MATNIRAKTLAKDRRPLPLGHGKHPRLWRLGDLTRLSKLQVELDLFGPIVPGQPLRFAWSTNNVLGLPLNLGSATASLYLVDNSNKRLFQKSIFSMTVPAGVIANGIYSSPPQTLERLPNTDPQAADLYRIGGGQGLELEVVCDGTDAGPFLSWIVLLDVVPEGDTLTWSWTDPPQIVPSAAQALPTKQVAWKEHYHLAGTLGNESLYSSKDCSIALRELDPEGNQVTYGPDNQPPSLHRNGGHVVVPWGGVDGFVQQWPWFISFVNSINGPLSKGFRYSVFADMSDEYGNAYATRQLSNDGWVEVTVSDQKKNGANAGEAAFAAFTACAALSLAFSWLPPVAAAFAVGAAVAAAVAGGASKIADDPPAPNSRFGAVVKVDIPDLGPALRECKALPALNAVFEAALRLVICVNLLSEVEGRMLGACAVDDRDALTVQLASYRELLGMISKDANRLKAAAPHLAHELDTSTMLKNDELKEIADQLKVPAGALNILREGRIGRPALALGSWIATTSRGSIAGAGDLADALASMAALLCLLASAALLDGMAVQRRFKSDRKRG